ncbi:MULTISPECIES: MspA/MspB/MIB-like signal-anchor domain-contatining protein [Spiroplasma]|nr:hypothetical protein [Spiroplasma ixodetis]WJG69636.1 hypothetical protein SIXOD_v1c05500 [Spiroplasma ixodetis Y32]
MSEKSKKKKIITAIVGGTTLVGGATAGILYTSDIEAKNEEENEKEKK